MNDYKYTPISKNIVICKGVCGGRPTFKYTRIEPIRIVSRLEKSGESIEDIVEDYRGKVTREALIEAVNLFGSEQLKQKFLSFEE